MIQPKPALVRPRVLVPDGAGPILLEDQVQARIEAWRPGLIELTGPAGSGKTTALAHLSYLFSDERFLALADSPTSNRMVELRSASQDQLVIVASMSVRSADNPSTPWQMARWTSEDCIEYLLAAHRDQCASVMRRVAADAEWRWLRGSPELCRVVLDLLAQDESIADCRAALHRELQSRLPTFSMRHAAGEYCADLHSESPTKHLPAAALIQQGSADFQLFSLLRHEPVQRLLAAEHLASVVKTDDAAKVLQMHHSDVLIQEIAKVLRDDEATLSRLHTFAMGKPRSCHATAASLLMAAGVDWNPSGQEHLRLMGAYLPGAKWNRILLTDADFSHVDLTNANLTDATLIRASARESRLDGAKLHGALLESFVATNASFTNADLSFVRASSAQFHFADLSNVNFEGARLTHADFEGACLREARFSRASLMHARFIANLLDDADFTGADFSFGHLIGLPLRLATFAGARFFHCEVLNCDMEWMVLPGADFRNAVLTRSHLTGSQMPNAIFHKADLRSTGLAEIEWERADLRDADLRGCTFHMGSSRSGLVGSPIACEGSKTGFYTDEFNEQDFKSPEEIRKANLCGADLRGARIDNVDFYLVDLRGAKYTPDQAEHFRDCGAILETRV